MASLILMNLDLILTDITELALIASVIPKMVGITMDLQMDGPSTVEL